MTVPATRMGEAGEARVADGTARWTAYGMALIASLALGHFLLGLPIQVSDSFGHLQQLAASWNDLLSGRFTQDSFFRPFMWAEMKAIRELSGGNYTPWFRGTHVVQVLVLTVMFVALVRIRTWRDVICLPLGLAVVLGMHTFSGTVTEAFPINTYMTVLLLCVAAAVLVLGRYRWWNDVLAIVLFVVAALTLETGLIVWVIFVGGVLLGARGVSRPALAVQTVLLGLYFYARFVLLDVGSPGLVERSSGFGFAVLDPPELIDRFGANPLPFYLYNVLSSALSVLASEPRSGVFRITQALTSGTVQPVMLVNAVASVGALALLGRFAWVRRRDWLARTLEHDDRIVLLSAMVLGANAAISYPYTKDVIMSPSGVFLAAAVAAAVRHLFTTTPLRLPPARAAVLIAAVAVVSVAWSLRALAVYNQLRQAAVTERLDWAYVELDIAEGLVHASTPEARALLEKLRHDALISRPSPPPLDLPFQALLSE